jgi:hypothetical protein
VAVEGVQAKQKEDAAGHCEADGEDESEVVWREGGARVKDNFGARASGDSVREGCYGNSEEVASEWGMVAFWR